MNKKALVGVATLVITLGGNSLAGMGVWSDTHPYMAQPNGMGVWSDTHPY